MKNLFKVGVLALVLVVVTGCGSKGKTLSCTKTSGEGIKDTTTITVTLKGDSASKVKVTEEYVATDEYSDFITQLASSFELAFADIKEMKGVSLKSNIKGNTFSYEYVADLTKMSKEDVDKLDMGDFSLGYDALKKSAEEDGYTCK